MLTTLDDTEVRRWNAKSVRDAITDAYQVLSAIEGRVGPAKRLKAVMPDFTLDYPRESQNWVKRRVRSFDVDRMEIVLLGGRLPNGIVIPAWLNGDVLDCPDHRYKLLQGCMARARDISDRSLCIGMGWPLATFQRHRDFAAGVVASQLNRVGMQPW